LLYDIIYSEKPQAYGIDKEKAYLRAFESLSSSSSLSSLSSASSQPLYSVCISIISSIITKRDAMKIKKKTSASIISSINAPRVARDIKDRFLYHHIQFGISYSIISNQHTMVNLLQNYSYKTCKLLQSLTASSLSSASSSQRRIISSGSNKMMNIGDGEGVVDPSSLSYSILLDSKNGLILSYEDYFTPLPSVVSPSTISNNKYNDNSIYKQVHINKECLFDIYYIPQSNESIDDEKVESQNSLSHSINKHLGYCDFSISTIISSLSIRLLLQILMLVLVDKPIILLSSSCTLLTKLQYIIPRLIWPFRINTTHVCKQILNHKDLIRFVLRNHYHHHKKGDRCPYSSSKYYHKNQKIKNYNEKKTNWRDMINDFAGNVGSYLSTPKWGSVKYSKNANRSLSEITILKKSKQKVNQGSSSSGKPHVCKEINDDNDDMISNRLNNFYQLNDVTIDNDNDESKRSPSYVDNNDYRDDDDDDDDDGIRHDGDNRNRFVCFSPDETIDTEIIDDYDSESDDVGDDDDDDCYNDNDAFVDDTLHSYHKHSSHRTSNVEDDISYIVGIESSVFYGASHELRHDLEDMRIKGVAFTIIDIDTGTLWVCM